MARMGSRPSPAELHERRCVAANTHVVGVGVCGCGRGVDAYGACTCSLERMCCPHTVTQPCKADLGPSQRMHAPCTCTMHHAPCTMRHAPCAMHHAPCTMHHARTCLTSARRAPVVHS